MAQDCEHVCVILTKQFCVTSRIQEPYRLHGEGESPFALFVPLLALLCQPSPIERRSGQNLQMPDYGFDSVPASTLPRKPVASSRNETMIARLLNFVRRSRWRKIVALCLLVPAVAYALLLIPERPPPAVKGAGEETFLWRQDEFWKALEARFREDRTAGCEKLAGPISQSQTAVANSLARLSGNELPAIAAELDSLETNFFQLAPMMGACPERLPDFLRTFAQMRSAIKRQSQHWPMDQRATRERLYRLLYGGRAAVEEAMLQAPPASLSELLVGEKEPSAAPFADVLGVKIHSGDIFLSRGGAATSALIARGNDFPGNFSHVAMAHVNEKTHAVTMIESHIECGVAIRPVEDYLNETKLRIMVLRLRADLPQLVADPILPHKAASLSLSNATSQHIPYDFTMDHRDASKLFCSEVAAVAYAPYGVTLWMGLSHLSSRGVTDWLASLGARKFETQEPSDLEYDPQLRVVAEWRDLDTLFKDHVDNAVIDVMLESAEAGEHLRQDWYMLPIVRVMKVYSLIQNWRGKVGPIPEGMTPGTALRVKTLKSDHAAIKARMLANVERFKAERGYVPPYWELVRLAREAKVELQSPGRHTVASQVSRQ